jgi:ABC-type cobalamin/Fe3+-siderophores transport system ATPase subunit
MRHEKEATEKSLLQPVLDKVRKYLKLNADDMPAVRFAMVIALCGFRLEVEDKPWGWLEGPSGSGKSELLRSFDGYINAMFCEDFTANGLVSSYVDPQNPDKDPSALKEADGKTLIVKDFSSIGMRDLKEVHRFFGIAAGVHDGFYCRYGGIGGKREYKVRMGFLLGSTYLPDDLRAIFNRIGERFVSFKMQRNRKRRQQRHEEQMHALDASKGKKEWREDLSDTAQTNLALAEGRMETTYLNFEFPKEDRYRIVNLADLVGTLRTLPRDSGISAPESGKRLALQLQNLAKVHCILDGRSYWSEEEDALCRRVAYDTLPQAPLNLLLAFYCNARPQTKESLQHMTNLPFKALNSLLEQFLYSELIYFNRGAGQYALTDDALHQIESSQLLLGAPMKIERTKR